MNFQSALCEYNFDAPYAQWMKRQADLWKQFCDKKHHNKNDVDKFKKFGRFFDKFYSKTHHFPKLQDIEKIL